MKQEIFSAFSQISLLLTSLIVTGVLAGRHEERLINNLIFNATGKGYQMLARPTAVESEAVEVQFGLTLMQIIEVDEKNEFLHTNVWLNYRWKDYKLSWNPDDYGGVQSIRLPTTHVWTPDILLYNSADEDIDSKFLTNVVVYSDGMCSWIPLGLYISACPIDITWFPFDDQYCELKFGSWTYDGSMINLTMLHIVNGSSVDLSSYQTSGEWDLIEVPAIRNVKVYDCCPEQYIDITFTIHIRRKTLYYGFNLIIPCALISMLTLLAFILPPDVGEKIVLTITILLSLSVFQLISAEMVPSTSMAVPLVGVYFASIMSMCTMSVIMNVLVLNFHHRSPDMYTMPNWVKRLICEWLAWLLRMSRPGRDLSHKILVRKSKLRELESKTPQSLSLISNIRGPVDNHSPLMRSVTEFSTFRSVSVDGEGPRCHMGGMGSCYDDSESMMEVGVRNDVLAILREIRFITRRMKDDLEETEETNDWKFAAMVVDRLCFYIFSAYLIIATAAIFISPQVVYRRFVGPEPGIIL